MSSDWDLIRIESYLDEPANHGRNVRLVRNGEPAKGVTSLKLETDVKGAIILTTVQFVRLEGPATLEEAVRSLREQAWPQEEPNAK